MRWGWAALFVLVAGAARGDEPPTVETRPTYLRLENGFGAPMGIFGASVGHAVAPPYALEVSGGLGASGLQLAILGRYYHPIGDSALHSWTLAAGPSLSLIGKPVGIHVPHEDDIAVDDGDVYYILGGNVELGWEVRFHWGGLIRVALGGFLRVSETMSHLCREDSSGAMEGPCGSLHLPTGPEVARLRAYPYLAIGYGWSF